MKHYAISEVAVHGIRSIAAYIAERNPSAAVKWLEQVDHLFSLLSCRHEIGECVKDIRPNLRRISLGNYVVYVVYFEIDAPIVASCAYCMRTFVMQDD